MRSHSVIASTAYFDSTGNSSPYAIYFNEGARNVVLRILSILNKTPDDIKKMYDIDRNDKKDYFK